MNQKQHITNIIGKGSLSSPDKPSSPVEYDLYVYEERIDIGGGDFLPGRTGIEGHIKFRNAGRTRRFSSTKGPPSMLTLEDGRKLNVLVLDSHGSVKGAGGFFE